MSAGMRIAGALLIAAFVAIGLAAVAGPTDANTGHQQKKLFEERWHYQPNGDYDAWMNLGTSDVWLNCDGSAAACGAKWDGPFTDSMADWNSQPMTVRFDYTDGVQDANFDVNVYIEDTVPGDPGLLGIGPTYDINGIPCWGACDVYSGIVWIGDDVHTPPYGTDGDRLATLSHEMGHIISLAHESTNSDESQLFDCGMDDTGPIPHSVMAYDCIDPVSIGGAGESAVQPWDTCGINHAYNDPAFAFSGCDLTTTTPSPAPTSSPSPTPAGSPTTTPSPSPSPSVGASPPAAPTASPAPTPSLSPTPTPLLQTFVWGDVNCSGGVNPVDSLGLLRFDAGLPVGQAPGCPALGNDLTPVAALQFSWGDVDCGGGINPVDALKVLRSDAGLSVGKPPGCPEIGSGLPVVVTS